MTISEAMEKGFKRFPQTEFSAFIEKRRGKLFAIAPIAAIAYGSGYNGSSTDNALRHAASLFPELEKKPHPEALTLAETIHVLTRGRMPKDDIIKWLRRVGK